jgi:hypothetical protein
MSDPNSTLIVRRGLLKAKIEGDRAGDLLRTAIKYQPAKPP